MTMLPLHRHDLCNSDAITQYVRSAISPGKKIDSLLIDLYRKLCYWDLVSDFPESKGTKTLLNELTEKLGNWNFNSIQNLNRHYYWLLGHQDILKKNSCFLDNDVETIARCISINRNVFPLRTPSNSKSCFEMICLGGANEIGGSCYAYRYKDTVFLVDAGIYQNREDQLPSFNNLPVEWCEKLKVIIITHLHADHCGALIHYNPRINKLGSLYLNHKPDIKMTPISKALFPEILQLNSIDCKIPHSEIEYRISSINSFVTPVENSFVLDDLRFTFLPVAHCPGAIMLHVKSPTGSLLHAADYSLHSAFGLFETDLTCIFENPVDSIVIEGTYGCIESDICARNRQLRIPEILKVFLEELEKRGQDYGSRRLFPSFAFGRSQELCQFIENCFPETTRIEGAAKQISSRLSKMNNEWKPVNNHGRYGRPNIIASSGWMEDQSASSSVFSELDENEVVILTGYVMPGTKAWEVTHNPLSGQPTVFSLPFSSHASFSQLLSVIFASGALRVSIIHRGYDSLNGLTLESFLESRSLHVQKPLNGEIVSV